MESLCIISYKCISYNYLRIKGIIKKYAIEKISESLGHLDKFNNWNTLNIFFNHSSFSEAQLVIFFYLLIKKNDNDVATQSTSFK